MVAAAKHGVIVDDEFRHLIPPLTNLERTGLEENLLRDGCLEPLIVWAEEQILLDGHNRKDLCERHGIDYGTREVSLPDREAAADWIDAHQLGRRNLSPDHSRVFNTGYRGGFRTRLRPGDRSRIAGVNLAVRGF